MTPQTLTNVQEKTSVTHRVSIGLIAISLGLTSLALGVSLLSIPLPASVFLATPPAPISAASTATAVTLTWTAPGDNGNTGQATSYDVRYSTAPITTDTFAQATAVAGVPAPQTAGSTESYTVTGLQPATTYFFALKTSDAAGNVSDLSNVVSKTTASIAVACVPTYSCSGWSTCANSVQTRTCGVTNGCPAGLDQPATQQSCTVPPTGGGSTILINHVIIVAAAPGVPPVFRVITPSTLKVQREVLAFAKADRHGTNVAAGDLDRDHQPDIAVGSGAGTPAVVKLFTTSGRQYASISPYPVSGKNGAAVAIGDVNGDGYDDLIVVPAKGTSQVRVYGYNPTNKKFNLWAQGFAYAKTATNGFTVAAGDLNNDGRAEIVVAPRTNGGSVVVLGMSGNTLKKLNQFSPYGKTISSGITVTIGDTDGNGRREIITTPGPGFYSQVKLFDQRGRGLGSFAPTSRYYLGGLTLSTLDVDQDGRDELLTGTYRSGDPGVRIYRYSGLTKKFQLTKSANVYAKTMKAGLRLASE